MATRIESRREWEEGDPDTGTAGAWTSYEIELELTPVETEQREKDAAEHVAKVSAIATAEGLKQRAIGKLKGLGLTDREINALWRGH